MKKLWILGVFLLLASLMPLANAKVIFDEKFSETNHLSSISQGETVVAKNNTKGIFFGGNSTKDEKAGLVWKKFAVDSWELEIENLRWSHNSALGGHPTEIALLNKKNDGYIVSIVNGGLILYRQNDNKRIELAKKTDWFNPATDYTNGGDFKFIRNSDGLITVQLGDYPLLSANDDTIKPLTTLEITYAVRMGGYGAYLDGIKFSGNYDGLIESMSLPVDITGGEILVDEQFGNFDGIKNISETDLIFPMAMGGKKMILGGNSTKGEKAGFAITNFDTDTFCLLLESIMWSHNNAANATEIMILDNKNLGYGLLIQNGNVTIFREDANSKRVDLATKNGVINVANGYITARNLIFARNSSGELCFAFDDDEDSILTVQDDTYNQFTQVQVKYAIQVWGQGVMVDQLFLKSLTKVNATTSNTKAIPSLQGKKIAILDNSKLLSPIRNMGTINAMANELTAGGASVSLIAAGSLAEQIGDTEILIFPAQSAMLNDLEAIDKFLKSKKIMLLLGEVALRNSIYTFNNGVYQLTDLNLPENKFAKDIVHRIYERIIGNNVAAIKTNLDDNGKLKLTVEGEKILGKKFSDFQVKSAQIMPLYNTIDKQALHTYVERDNLLTVQTTESNWIQIKDKFIGSVAQLQYHRNGDFFGARLLVVPLPFGGASPINPANKLFADFVAKSLVALEKEVSEVPMNIADVLTPLEPLTRDNFYNYSGHIFTTLCFGHYEYLNDDKIFQNDLNEGGFNAVTYMVPWLYEVTSDGQYVDWALMDKIINECTRINKRLILDPYPVTFNPRHFAWRKGVMPYHPEFQEIYTRTVKDIAKRYKNNPTLVGMWCTSYTADSDFEYFKHEEKTPEVTKMYQEYLAKKYSLAELNRLYQTNYKSFADITIPQEQKKEVAKFNLGPQWADLLDFHLTSYQNFMRKSIEAIRSEVPNMPLTTRGAFIDFAPTLEVASEYKNVGSHSECIETTYNVEGYYRSLGRSFEVPITAENGWPKALPAAMRMAMANYLLGDYSFWAFSFAGPRWARDVFPYLNQAAMLRGKMAGAKYGDRGKLGLLISDTTLYASKPASFFSIETQATSEFAMEQSSYHFIGVSSYIPRFKELEVIVDDGMNLVLTRKFIDMLTKWISDGGVYVTYASSGVNTLDNSKNFWETTRINAKAGEYKYGKGRVIVLNKVINDGTEMAKLLSSLKLTRDFEINSSISNATLTSADGKAKYLIIFDKSRDLVGSFFVESNHSNVLSKLKAKKFTVKPNFEVSEITDIVNGKTLQLNNGVIELDMAPLDLVVIEFKLAK